MPIPTEIVTNIRSSLEGLEADLDKLIASHQRLFSAAEQICRLHGKLIQRLAGLKGTAEQTTSPSAVSRMIQEIQEMKQDFNLQYILLQQQVQFESRQFSMVSSSMRTRHDTARNSIGNLR